MPLNKTYTVKSASEFPNWKEACPECGAKYPKPAISARKDGTASWCKSCGTNWKIAINTPAGWNQLGAKLGARTSPEASGSPTRVVPQADGFAVLTENVIALRDEVKTLIALIKEQLSL